MKHQKDKKCPFCNSSISDAVFAETEDFIAVYNVAPILPGHSMILPKWHVETVLQLNDAEISQMAVFSKNVMSRLMAVFKATGFNWTIQQGEEGGQTVRHLHLHLIPRHAGDLPHPGDWYPLLQKSQTDIIDSELRPRLTTGEVRRVANEIRAAFEAESSP